MRDGRYLLRHELTWLHKAPEIAAADITRFVKAQKIDLQYVAANPDLWPKKGKSGQTVCETFQRAGVPMVKGSDDRINAWARLRSLIAERQWVDRTVPSGFIASPSLLIHPDCKYFLRTFPTLVSDQTNPDDVQESTDEYPALGASYWAMTRPAPEAEPEPELPPGAIGHDLRKLRAELEAAL
jgi:hypothetical protein